ncbi:MAG: hypothetical protein KKE20_06275 [Nanoarchaeota archaeon]|nr:hypothetical protein [Nanoarchaeota archaeon]
MAIKLDVTDAKKNWMTLEAFCSAPKNEKHNVKNHHLCKSGYIKIVNSF